MALIYRTLIKTRIFPYNKQTTISDHFRTKLFYNTSNNLHSKVISMASVNLTNRNMNFNPNAKFNSADIFSTGITGMMTEKVRCISTDQKPEEPVKLTTKQKFKKAITEYGSTVIVFHVTISLLSLGTCYLLVSSGLEVTTILKYIEYIDVKYINADKLSNMANSNIGTFVFAYALHKVFSPVRLAITLASTPFIVRHLRRIGFIKPPTNVKK